MELDEIWCAGIPLPYEKQEGKPVDNQGHELVVRSPNIHW